MSDAPSAGAISLDDVPQGIQDALEANFQNDQAFSHTWLSDQTMRTNLRTLCFRDEAERKLILSAWRGVGWAARAARGQHADTYLADITFSSESPTAMSGLAPTIRAEDFERVLRDTKLLSEARGYDLRDPHNLCDLSLKAVKPARVFLDRLRTHLHN